MSIDELDILRVKVGQKVTVTADALMRGNQVYVKDDTVTQQSGPVPAEFRAAEVETGMVSDSYVVIKSGLSQGDVVYVAESSKSSSGAFMMMDMGGGPGGGGGQGGSGGRSQGGSGRSQGGGPR